ncbi:hypothetical protein [Oceanicaulis alexandrii]|uniref:hypothetical protein n=1 Tax=Oceanicaulis alexandrii TaxID=153233 RepID=UPI00235634C4|nr:hypothetical protein [Oceanicaulis alexandrii]
MNRIETIFDELAADGFQLVDVQRTTAPTAFKTKVLAAADKQIALLAQKTDAAQLNYASKGNSGKYWWGTKPVNNQRLVRVYVANRLLYQNMQAIRVPNTVDSVRHAILAIRAKAEARSEADWEAFADRREQARKKAAAKK